MYLIRTISIFLILFICANGFGQSIRGQVTDDLLQPIPGVNIVNKTSGTHAHSDVEGRFLLEGCSLNDFIQITSVGFETLDITLDNLDKELKLILRTRSFSLDQVVINSSFDALNLLSDIELKTDPVNSSQEMLRKVPGLFIGQHAGGGKAEQIFLRGFDIDHGTDIKITVDDVPVNMVSHAHGQGYADLHFLIPETVEKVDFGKGPYKSEHGNFATAGFVNFQTKDRLKNNLLSLSAGQFAHQRFLGMFNLLNKEKQSAYIAAEFLMNDGPFESPQNFVRKNIFAKYSGFTSDKDRIELNISSFRSNWDASGQIPQRKVDDGTISRFGAIDDTEGGETGRNDIRLNHLRFINDKSYISSTAFLFNYDFELFSNFTFFLNDSINGDQIKQKEKRNSIGINSEFVHSYGNSSIDGTWKIGLGLRNDQTKDTELSRTLNRFNTLEFLRKGDIQETNAGLFVENTLNVGDFTFAMGIRGDIFNFQYADELANQYSKETRKLGLISPKFSVLYKANEELQFYLKTGKGFHSNDSRVVIDQSAEILLPAAYGWDIGFIWKPFNNILFNTAIWQLHSDQEFVYVGDEGIVEPSGKSRREGVDLSMRYQASEWLFWNLDFTYANARALENSDRNYIPLAPNFTFVSSVNVLHPIGIYGGVNLRFLNDRPATEDNSILAPGYTVVDLNMGYQLKRFDLGFEIQNLLNTEWNETQFATTSQLQDEPEPIEEIHFTPGTPFFISAKLAFRF